MFHKRRTWCIHVVQSPEQLAEMLTQQTWTLCSGFAVAGHEDYLFLNDATHEDGAGEYAIIKGGLCAERRYQIESITFSWCTTAEALEYILAALRGEYDGEAREVTVSVQSVETHGRCPLCA